MLLVAAGLLLLAIAASLRHSWDGRLIEQISAHPNIAVHPVELGADRFGMRSRIARLLYLSILRENRDHAVSLDLDAWSRYRERMRLWLAVLWVAALCACAYAMRELV